MVLASVSKLVTALTVARLAQEGVVGVDQFVPWEAMGFVADPAWATVTVGDLLDHTSGVPVARKSWLDDPGPCAVPLAAVLAGTPSPERGTWVYSNGNYCALGLLVELVTGERYDGAAYRLVLTPAGITGPHLTVDGSGPDDAPYAKGVARFDRLGGAGQWMASTDDVAALLASITDLDRDVLTWPGILADQYGWGHTGSVDGAFSCAWVIGDGRAVVSATVSGATPGSGGGVCDLVLPAAAADLGLPYLGEPVRTPE
jgi:CubicO group peptidase (beta-lactamase class C family)